MLRSLIIISTIIFSLALVNCNLSTSNLIDADPKDSKLSLVYGFIDFTKGPQPGVLSDRGYLHWIRIMKISPGPWEVFECDKNIPKGIFWHYGIPKGSYQIYDFGTNFHNGQYTFQMEDAKIENSFNVNEPGLYYIGSYKFVFGNSSFNLEPSTQENEQSILTYLLKYFNEDPEKFSRQIKMIKKRLYSQGIM